MDFSNSIDLNNVPKHIAIIMDGNGRWAKQTGQDRIFGHFAGVEAIRKTVKAADDFGVKHLTLYAFSTENWNRPKAEVDSLMDLIVDALIREIDALDADDVKVSTIGNTGGLPLTCQTTLYDSIERTKNNQGLNLIFALNYSSRWEIIDAIKKISQNYKAGQIDLDQIDENLLSQSLTTAGIPDPELVIRTSGEHRLSNFLLWQSSYAEFHFAKIYWPDFDREHLAEAIYDYQNRERRFGLVSEQVKNEQND